MNRKYGNVPEFMGIFDAMSNPKGWEFWPVFFERFGERLKHYQDSPSHHSNSESNQKFEFKTGTGKANHKDDPPRKNRRDKKHTRGHQGDPSKKPFSAGLGRFGDMGGDNDSNQEGSYDEHESDSELQRRWEQAMAGRLDTTKLFICFST